MKRTNSAVLAVVFLAVSLPPLSAGVVVFPAPDGVGASPHFRVELFTDEGWRPSFVYHNPARTDGLGALDQPGRSMSWTTFLTDSSVRVRVTSVEGNAVGVVVRPSRHQIIPEQVDDRVVEFLLKPGQKVSVEFEHTIRENCFTGPPHGIPCVMHGLLIFADRLAEDDPLADYSADEITAIDPGKHSAEKTVEGLPNRSAHLSTLGNAHSKRIVRFLPGVHDLGYWQVPNNVDHVHLDPGAVVFGAIDVLPEGRDPHSFDVDEVYRDSWFKETLRKEFKLTGHGVLSGAKLPWHLKKDFSYHADDHWWAHVKLLQLAVENIVVCDVTLVDSPYWVISFINDTDKRTKGRFKNFKLVGAWTYNNDGLPVPGAEDSVVRDAFIHANDDAFKLYNTGGRVENCVVCQGNNGAVFQFGWFPKTVGDVVLRDVDVIRNENWYGVGLGNRAIFNFADAGGQGVIEDFLFENIAIEGGILRLFGFQALDGQVIRDFHFNNLSVGGIGAGQLGAPGRNYFIGRITGFEFDNFSIGGEAVRTAEDAWLEFDQGAGQRFKIDGVPITDRPSLSVRD